MILFEEKLTAPDNRVCDSSGLTARESEVLGSIAQGKTNREIAAILGMQTGTVKKPSSATNAGSCMTWKGALPRAGQNYPEVFVHPDTNFTFTARAPRVSPASPNYSAERAFLTFGVSAGNDRHVAFPPKNGHK